MNSRGLTQTKYLCGQSLIYLRNKEYDPHLNINKSLEAVYLCFLCLDKEAATGQATSE